MRRQRIVAPCRTVIRAAPGVPLATVGWPASGGPQVVGLRGRALGRAALEAHHGAAAQGDADDLVPGPGAHRPQADRDHPLGLAVRALAGDERRHRAVGLQAARGERPAEPRVVADGLDRRGELLAAGRRLGGDGRHGGRRRGRAGAPPPSGRARRRSRRPWCGRGAARPRRGGRRGRPRRARWTDAWRGRARSRGAPPGVRSAARAARSASDAPGPHASIATESSLVSLAIGAPLPRWSPTLRPRAPARQPRRRGPPPAGREAGGPFSRASRGRAGRGSRRPGTSTLWTLT